MSRIKAVEGQTIYLGLSGENEATEIVFDISDLLTEYPQGHCELIVRKPYISQALPVPVVQSENEAVWTVTDSDLVTDGNGEAQLLFYCGNVCKRRNIYKTFIDRSLGMGSGDTSRPDGWITDIVRVGADARKSADEAEASAKRAEDAVTGFDGTVQTATEGITAEGTKQTGLVTDEGTKQAKLVTDKGTEQVDFVANKGSEEVVKVTVEGNAQVKRVQEEAQGIAADREQIQKNKNDILLAEKDWDEYFTNKNIFNKNNFEKAFLAVNKEKNMFVTFPSMYAIILPCNSNTTYTISKRSSKRFVVASSKEKPLKAVIASQVFFKDMEMECTITTKEDDHYLFINYYYKGTDVLTEQEILDSIQVEIGDKKTNYAPYGVAMSERHIKEIKEISDTYSDGLLNLLSYRPLGTLQRGYICLSSDDGTENLVNFTIPKLKEYKNTYNRNIPMTFGLMRESKVFENIVSINTVKEMIENYGCDIAVHGLLPFTNFSQVELKRYLISQEKFLTEKLGVEPSSIIYPEHKYNTMITTVCGGRYGVCCTGGTNHPIYYTGYCAGNRSNMYQLYRFSLFNSTTTEKKIKESIDYAFENHMIFLPFYHDNDLKELRNQQLLDYCVQYAIQKGLTFSTLNSIPTLI